jgi:aryl-alcohol dehydrogenase-like predicted oxidoreductase
METRKLGNSDLEVSLLGLGCNNFGMKIDLTGSRGVLDAAIDVGINFFDTADLYGDTQSEAFIGEVLEGRRQEVLIGTKFGGIAFASGGSNWGQKQAIVDCCEASLSRLRTDYIDLYQIHYPDPETPIDETLAALGELVQSGKVRAIGCSNFTRELLEQAGIGSALVSLQNEWSLLQREVEAELVPACEKQGIGFLPYFPLASGVLTGKYRPGADFAAGTRLAELDYFTHFGSDANLDLAQKLGAFAEERGHSLLELAFGWLASQPSVASVIAGASRPDQVQANAVAMGWVLSASDFERVDEITRPSAS